MYLVQDLRSHQFSVHFLRAVYWLTPFDQLRLLKSQLSCVLAPLPLDVQEVWILPLASLRSRQCSVHFVLAVYTDTDEYILVLSSLLELPTCTNSKNSFRDCASRNWRELHTFSTTDIWNFLIGTRLGIILKSLSLNYQYLVHFCCRKIAIMASFWFLACIFGGNAENWSGGAPFGLTYTTLRVDNNFNNNKQPKYQQ